MSKNLKAYNIFDLREIALKRVPKGLFEFMDRGTEDEVSLQEQSRRVRPPAVQDAHAGGRFASATRTPRSSASSTRCRS